MCDEVHLSDQEKPAKDHASKVTELLATNVGTEYSSAAKWASDLKDAVSELIGQRLEPAFNQTLSSMPQETLANKQDICRFANQELRNLGLAIRCPRTGQPASLHADRGNNHKAGVFQIELLGSESARRKTKHSSKLFPFELMSRPVRVEGLANFWATKVDSDARGTGKSQ